MIKFHDLKLFEEYTPKKECVPEYYELPVQTIVAYHGSPHLFKTFRFFKHHTSEALNSQYFLSFTLNKQHAYNWAGMGNKNIGYIYTVELTGRIKTVEGENVPYVDRINQIPYYLDNYCDILIIKNSDAGIFTDEVVVDDAKDVKIINIEKIDFRSRKSENESETNYDKIMKRIMHIK